MSAALDAIPTLEEALGVKAPTMRGESRVVRNLDADGPPSPSHLPKLMHRVHRIARPEEDAALKPKGEAMPKGVYPRKPRKGKSMTSEQSSSAATTTKPKRKAPVLPAKGARKPVGAATFVVNDRGAMEIRDGQQVINLERDDVKRLEAFLTHSKGLRK